MTFVAPVVEYWLEWEIAQWVRTSIQEVSTYLRQRWTLCRGHRTQPSVCRAAETEPKRPSTWSTTQWTHSLHPRRQLYGRKAGNVLFNDALNTFYLRLYGIGEKQHFNLIMERINECLNDTTAWKLPQPLLHQSWISGWNEEGNILFNDAINTFYLRLYGRERNVLFNDALNTFYLRLYGMRHMVKDHSDSEKGNPLLPLLGLLLPINSKGSFICTIPQTG